jgi:hypothetical protein
MDARGRNSQERAGYFWTLVYDLEASCTNVQLPQAIFVQNFATLFKCCTTILFLELKFLPREIISKKITYISKYHNIYF